MKGDHIVKKVAFELHRGKWGFTHKFKGLEDKRHPSMTKV